jgi:hypothetical protein
MRSHLIEAFNLWLKVGERELAIVGKVVNMLHNASLMYVLLPPSYLRSRTWTGIHGNDF